MYEICGKLIEILMIAKQQYRIGYCVHECYGAWFVVCGLSRWPLKVCGLWLCGLSRGSLWFVV